MAVVGCGVAGRLHAIALSRCRETELVAAVDDRPLVGARFARRWQIALLSLRDVLASDSIDAVVVATPTGAHAPAAIAALEAGKHVLLEKPAEISVARARHIERAATRAKRVCGVAYVHRRAPGIQRLRSLIARQVLAPAVVDLRVQWYRPPRYYRGWRGTWALDGGGALMNQGSHYVDLMRYLFGEPIRVSCGMRRAAHAIEAEDTAVVLLEFPRTLAVLSVTTVAPSEPVRLLVHGRNWTAEVQDDALIRGPRFRTRAAPENAAVDVPSGAAHTRIWHDFASAVAAGSEPIAPISDAVRTQELLARCYRAARASTLRPRKSVRGRA